MRGVGGTYPLGGGSAESDEAPRDSSGLVFGLYLTAAEMERTGQGGELRVLGRQKFDGEPSSEL